MLVCPSDLAAGLFPMTCFNSIRVIPRSAFLLPAALQLLRQKGSLEPRVLPAPEDFIIAGAAGLSFSPITRAMQYKIACSALHLI